MAAPPRFLLRLATSNKHVVAAITRQADGVVVASASTAEREGEERARRGGAGGEAGASVSSASVEQHRAVGQRLATRAVAAGVDTVSWVRAGRAFHGRARALVEALRGGGVGLG